jgi:hypothetical protein
MIIHIGIIIGVIGIIVTIIVGIFPNPIRDFILERIGKSLQIKPRKKDILFSEDGNNWSETFFVYLTNNTNNTYYDISIISEFPSSIEVDILPENSSEFSGVGSKDGKMFIGLDFMLAGEIKEKKAKIVQTVINNIGPNEKKKIKVVVNKRDYSKNFRLKFKVSGFSKTSKPILNK